MLRNYLTISYRNLLLNKSSSLINILGLTVGITTVVIIYLYVKFEFSYDDFHQKANRMYRVYHDSYENGEVSGQDAFVPAVLAQTFQNEIPEMEEAVRLMNIGQVAQLIFRYKDKVFNEKNVFLADSNFHKVFSVHYLAGNPATALRHPNSLVLTEPMAKKYFGKQNPMGQLVELNKELWKVTGVVKPFPSASHLHFDALLSMVSSKGSKNTWWLDNAFMTYVLLKENARVENIKTKIEKLIQKHASWQFEIVFKKPYSQLLKEGKGNTYSLLPVTDIHLHTAHINDFVPRGNILYVYLFSLVGLVVLLIACFNYINLTTAKSITRAREVGIRKVLGASKPSLLKLFLTESFLIAFAASILSLTLIQVALQYKSGLLTLIMPHSILESHVLWIFLGVFTGVGFLSGAVPAFYVSAYLPVQVLKGQLISGKGGEKIRKVLVVTQFAISTFLIICTLLVNEQLTFLQNKQLGFDKENVIILNNVEMLGNRQGTLKKVLKNEAFVADASLCYNMLGTPYNVTSFSPAKGNEDAERKMVGIPRYVGDADFLETLKIPIKMGHNFPENLSAAHPQIMLSEEAIRQIGWNTLPLEEIIGQKIDVIGRSYELVAIIGDINFRSLKEETSPAAVFSHHPDHTYDHLLLRIKSGNYVQALEKVQAHWNIIAPDVPFVYAFLDEHLNQLYHSEQQISFIFNVFSGLAIFVASLGLIGLTIYMAERRTKEIGVRKVLGASIVNILLLLNKEIIRLILLATLIAWPLAYWGFTKWVQNYAFRISSNPWMFVLPSILVFLIALLTVSMQTIKAARKNPVKSLRYE